VRGGAFARKGGEPMTNQPRMAPRKKLSISGYLFILPFFVVYIAFQLYPQLYSFLLSFSYYKFGHWQGLYGLRIFRTRSGIGISG
jgi:ABC-type sugar transport system permease subunit